MKKGMSKSAKARALREKNPNITVTEIVAQMKKEGDEVSAPLVYQALSKKKSGNTATQTKGKKRGPKPGTAAKKRGPKPGSVRVKAAPSVASTDQDLFASMQNFVTAAGSMEKAIEILSVFKR